MRKTAALAVTKIVQGLFCLQHDMSKNRSALPGLFLAVTFYLMALNFWRRSLMTLKTKGILN